LVVLLGLAVVLAGCGGAGSKAALSGAASVSSSKIQHVVIIMQENRTFDNLFYGFPGADSATNGMSAGKKIALVPVALNDPRDLGHTHGDWWNDWNNGAMDGFGRPGTSSPLLAYSYVPSSQIQPYWTMAKAYTLGDRMFQSNSGPSFPAYQYMIAGQSGQAAENPPGYVWGCDSPQGTTVALIGPNGTDAPGAFPCFDYQTIADELNTAGLSWRYYAATDDKKFSIFSAFEAIKHIFKGRYWTNNVISPQTTVLTDIANGELAQVTWVTSDFEHSDHPASKSNEGPDWVASVVNAIGNSQFWNSTAIFITWDDWGGWYDHVAPQAIDEMGPGFRVPLIVVSPFAKHGYVSHEVYETASLLTYIESNFGLKSLGNRDAIANGFSDCFDYAQTPQPFTTIKTSASP